MRAAAAALIGLVAGAAAAAEIAPAERRSDTAAMSPALRAMQADDLANPASLTAADGEALWAAPAEPEGRSCASCHGDAAQSMRGVAARYPAWDEGEARAIDLGGRISLCRTRHQAAPPFAPESPDRLALETFLGRQSRSLPIVPAPDARMRAMRERGKALFGARVGQLNLSCAICHDDSWGRRLGGTVIPQGHPVGYPIYRLEWQAVGSLQRRLRNCLTGVRAEPYPFDAPELVALEAYLMERAAGLPVETPAVRP